MWCDNCLLIFPLRHGAIAWNVFIALYNIAGSILLFKYGMFLFFDYPEAQIYGGIGMAAMAIAVLSILALSNNSYMFARLVFYVQPIILIVVAVRAGFMMFQLDRQQSKIVWECNNGGIEWGTGSQNTTDSSGTSSSSSSSSSSSNGTMPSGMCSAGFHSLYIAFVLSLLADFVCQVYAYFMAWRFKKRIEHYTILANNDKFNY